MIDRINLKIREIIHYLSHITIYKSNVILYGVPIILYGEKIDFGKKVRINERVYLHGKGGITIGDNTTLSYGVCIITESYNTADKNEYLHRHHSHSPIVIGKNVWLCANTIVLPGVNIADNIIVGAGSVVTKDLTKSNSLYAGNPAKFIKDI